MKFILFLSFLLWPYFMCSQQTLEFIDPVKVLENANEEFKNEEYDKALGLINSIHQCDSNYYEAMSVKVSILFKTEEYEKLVNLAQHLTSSDLGKKYVDVKIQEAVALMGLEKYDEALELLQKLREIYTANYLIYYNIAIIYQVKEQYEMAVEYLKKTILYNPVYDNAHLQLGALCLRENKISQALLCYNTYLLMNPDGEGSLDILYEINTAVSSKEYRDPVGIQISKDDSCFKELDLIVNNYIALNNNYPIDSDIKFSVIRQNHALMTKLQNFKGNGGFFDRLYVPFYREIFSLGYFEPFYFRLSSSSTNENYVKKIEKKNKRNDDFIIWFLVRWYEIVGKNWHPKQSSDLVYYYNEFGPLKYIQQNITSDTCDILVKYYFENGNLLSTGGFRNNEKNGYWIWYDETGQPKEEVNYKNGVANGIYNKYYPNGKLMFSVNVRNGKYEGTFTKYYKNGNLQEVSNYTDGQLNGLGKLYHPQGEKFLFMEVPYKDGKIDGIFKKYYKNGNISLEVEYKEGERISEKQYFMSGNLSYTYEFSENRLNGPFVSYFQNGKVHQKGKYTNDVYTGEFIEYYIDGTLAYLSNYDDKGRLHGKYIEYNMDSTKKSEFEYDKNEMVFYAFYDKKGNELSHKRKTGRTLTYKALNPNNTILFEGEFDAGNEPKGQWKFYSTNGILSRVSNYKDGQTQGKEIQYFPNGNVSTIRNYEKGLRQGHYISLYLDSTMYQQGYYVDNLAERLWYKYYPDGSLELETYYFHNGKHGFELEYSVEGHLTSKTYYDESSKIYSLHFDTTGTLTDSINYFLDKPQAEHFPNDSVSVSYTCSNGELHGKYTSYYYNGKVYSTGEYVGGKRHGPWKWFYDSGALKTIVNYEFGLVHGKWVEYYKDSTLRVKRNFVYDEEHGDYETYSESGHLTTLKKYWYGKAHGPAKFFNENGTLEMVRYYDHGKIIGHSYYDKNNMLVPMIPIEKETGKVTVYYANGQKSREFEIFDGEFHNRYIHYHENGKISSDETYTHGLLQGESTDYFDNSQLQKKCYYKNDYLHGPFKQYYKNGQLKSEEIYKNGKITGPAKYFDSKGNLERKIYYYDGDEQSAEYF